MEVERSQALIEVRLSEADAEELLPDAIDCDSGHKWMFRISQPYS